MEIRRKALDVVLRGEMSTVGGRWIGKETDQSRPDVYGRHEPDPIGSCCSNSELVLATQPLLMCLSAASALPGSESPGHTHFCTFPSPGLKNKCQAQALLFVPSCSLFGNLCLTKTPITMVNN